MRRPLIAGLAGFAAASLALFLLLKDSPAPSSPAAAADAIVTNPGTVEPVAALLPPPAPATGGASAPRPNTPPRPPASPSVATIPTGSRAWDPRFLPSLAASKEGASIRFELLNGTMAEGRIEQLIRESGVPSYVAGRLTRPESGKFFFRRQAHPGQSDTFIGVVEFPVSQTAYNLEPATADGTQQWVGKRLGDVICLKQPLPPPPTNSTANIPPLNPSQLPNNLPIPPYQNGITVLESFPTAAGVIYLDFQGGYTPTWGGITYARPNASNSTIYDIWKRVAERYMPFRVNVTTDLRVFTNANQYTRIRCVFTPTTTAAPGAGGVAYLGSYTWGGTYPNDTVCWSFYSDVNGADVAAHEVGHTFGLNHWGQLVNGTDNVEYYSGQGSGAVSWCPIMGVSYGKALPQWSKGEYQWAHASTSSGTQNDLAVISAKAPYRIDDTGSSLTTARYLEIFPNYTASAEGVIERTGEVDAFRFTTSGGNVSLTANPVGSWSSLATAVVLADANGSVILSNSPQTTISASIRTNLPAGTYAFRVTGAARNNPLTTGFSSYGSLGYYSITGSVANAVLPTRFSIRENTANGTPVGIVPANNPNNDPLQYFIVSGNKGTAFALDDAGQLTVANQTVLDYETLAASSQLTVQFEMFVNIINSVNPDLSELDRRLVVAITDVNEPPVVTDLSVSALGHTRPGTLLGRIVATDPDSRTLLSYAITDGNTNGLFAIDAVTGELRINGDLDAAVQAQHQIQVRVSDQAKTSPLFTFATATVNVLPNTSPFQPGAISYAVYDDLSATNLISGLTGAITFPYDPTFEKQVAAFEGDANRADQYGATLRGFLIPPFTGSYTFWIASDDNGELMMSTSTNTTTLVRIAHVTGNSSATGPREWTKYSSQQSVARTLIAGQAYYIEARMKEGGGGDNLSVAWQCAAAGIAREVIPARFVAPYAPNYFPHLTGVTSSLHRDAIQGSRVGQMRATDANAADRFQFTLLEGNPRGIFSLDPTNGIIRILNEDALKTGNETDITLRVRVTDNGIPARSATNAAVFHLVATNAITTPTLQQEIWTNVNGTAVSALSALAAFPKRPHLLRPITDFNSETDFADNYGSRIRATVKPPASGPYAFYIASDDNSSLRFSLTTNAGGASSIASVADYTDPLQWTKFTSQKSTTRTLNSALSYYIEALHKEGGGGDHVAVGWTGPNIPSPVVIPAESLSPVDLNFAPDLPALAVTLSIAAPQGTLVATLKATDSPLDTITYKLIEPPGLFTLDPDSGRITVTNATLLNAQMAGPVSVRVTAQDSGYGDLYPRRSTTTVVTVYLQEASTFVWTGAGTNGNWSEPGNWANGILPTEGSNLIFSGNVRTISTNDLLTSIRNITFSNGGFQIRGQPVSLSAGFNSDGDNEWNIPTTVPRVTVVTQGSGNLTLSGAWEIPDASLQFDGAGSTRISGSIRGTGSLSKRGQGTLVLSGINTLAGLTQIDEGTLTLSDSRSVPQALLLARGSTVDTTPLADGWVVGPSQSLTGIGSVNGNVQVTGRVSNDRDDGFLTFNNNLVLNGATQLFLGSDGTTNGSFNVIGSLALGGSLRLSPRGVAPAVGTRLTLFRSPRISGSFTSYDLPALPEGLAWNTSRLGVDGTLAVVPDSLNVTFSIQAGGGLQLQIPTQAGRTYVLQSTTNLTPPIVWTAQDTHAGDGQPLLLSVPPLGEPGQIFYRVLAE